MYGLEAISANNGWAQALAGACIVMTGLTVLSFLISQLHRIVDIVEGKKDKTTAAADTTAEETQKTVVPEKLPSNLIEAAGIYKSFVDELGSSFKLADLYRLAQDVGLPHPHLSIRGFRDEGLLESAGNDLFSWKQSI